jgi:hypothetical protein
MSPLPYIPCVGGHGGICLIHPQEEIRVLLRIWKTTAMKVGQRPYPHTLPDATLARAVFLMLLEQIPTVRTIAPPHADLAPTHLC